MFLSMMEVGTPNIVVSWYHTPILRTGRVKVPEPARQDSVDITGYGSFIK